MFCSDFRRSINCILPPHILRQIARNGGPRERESALKTLALDQTSRTSRITYQAIKTAATRQAVMGAAPTVKQRTIYDAKSSEVLPGTVTRDEGQSATPDAAVNDAFDGLGSTFDFYLDVYSRNSIDDEGLHLDATVHYAKRYNNAFWNGQQMVFGDGDNVIFKGFTRAIDVIAHELTHGVTGDEANLVYLGQSGALNESISDVFGSLVKQYTRSQDAKSADWLIGEGIFTEKIHGKALRSMSEPGTAYDDELLGKDPQPATMDGYVETADDNGGVHINSGIPNRAFYLVAEALGGNAWEKAGQIWYDTLRDPRLKRTATFFEFASRTSFNAGHRYGSSSPERQAVIAGWNEVGIKLQQVAIPELRQVA